MQVTE